MKVFHLADTHLGYSAYRKVTDEGVNQREIDVYNAFTQCIDHAINTKPDLVLHAGDLFDSVRPTNRAITIAIQQILRLSKENIPFIVISGNHETPKLKETGNIFRIFEHLKNVYPIHNNQYEALSIPLKNETVTIHAIPQCQSPEDFDANFKKISINKKADYNLLLAHGAVAGIKEFKMNEFNELFIPVKNLKEDFDYIALGHYHMHTKLQENAFYPGSTEYLSFTEANTQKGFVQLDLGRTLKHRFIPLKTRVMVDVPVIDCSALSLEQMLKEVKEALNAINPDNKIIRIRLENIPLHLQRALDFHQLREWGKTAVHLEIKTTHITPEKTDLREGYLMKSLSDEFDKFVATQRYPEKKMLLSLGISYINKIEEQEKKP